MTTGVNGDGLELSELRSKPPSYDESQKPLTGYEEPDYTTSRLEEVNKQVLIAEQEARLEQLKRYKNEYEKSDTISWRRTVVGIFIFFIILIGVAYGLGYFTAVRKGPDEYTPYN